MSGSSPNPGKRLPCPHQTSICTIAVGNGEVEFYVHSGVLQATSFFAQHGPPKPRPPRTSDGAQKVVENPMFFPEDEDTFPREAVNEVIDLTKLDADYVLKDKFFYKPDAMHVFLSHLHGAVLEIPETAEQCKTLFRAYAFAQEYDLNNLQNNIIDVLQRYYLHHSIAVSDLMWAVDRFHDKIECPLVMYLISQAGYEMACGWEKFRKENEEISILLGSGKKGVLEHLLNACLKYGSPASNADPAKNKKSWRQVTM